MGTTSSSICHRRERVKVHVRSATTEDLADCVSIEQNLKEDRVDAEREGFLLSGNETIETYSGYQKLGAFWVAERESNIVGFLFALPPQSDRMRSLLQLRDRCVLRDNWTDVFDRGSLAWVAKIGVIPEFMGRGIGASLYNKLLTTHPEWNLLTTTVMTPIDNAPSAALQRRFGFFEIGTMPIGNRGTLKDVVCRLHFRPAEGALSA